MNLAEPLINSAPLALKSVTQDRRYWGTSRRYTRLGNQHHIGLGGDDRVRGFAAHRMVLNAQNANHFTKLAKIDHGQLSQYFQE
jgi:hypothetical protein